MSVGLSLVGLIGSNRISFYEFRDLLFSCCDELSVVGAGYLFLFRIRQINCWYFVPTNAEGIPLLS